MKAASSQLKTLLASRQFFAADLYQFTLIGGGTLNYCSGDKDVVWNGITWSAGKSTGPYIDRKDNKAKCHWKLGVEVDTLIFDVIPQNALVNGQAFLSAVRQGVFDGAELILYRAFMPTYGNTAAGTVIMFVGRVAEVDFTRSLVTFSVNSHLELLNQNLPRNLYQASCVNTLFDGSCGLIQANFANPTTALTGSTASVLNTNIAQVSGYFDLGTVTFTSGANNGVSRSVKSWINGTPGTLQLISPLPNVPAAGDAFTAYPGCDKTQATCKTKFSNLANFRGFPYVPENSTAV